MVEHVGHGCDEFGAAGGPYFLEAGEGYVVCLFICMLSWVGVDSIGVD